MEEMLSRTSEEGGGQASPDKVTAGTSSGHAVAGDAAQAPNRYLLQPGDIAYVREFMARPIGYHSPGLQRVLNVMRGGRLEGKYVLVVLEPYRRWALGRLPGRRGAPVELLEGIEYTDQLDAERDVFRRRWKDLTGNDLPSDVVALGSNDCSIDH